MFPEHTICKIKKSAEKISIEESSGNIFVDLGLPNPEEALMKAELAHEIHCSIERLGLTVSKAAALMNIDAKKLQAILRGDWARISIEKLMRHLRILGNEVALVVKPISNETNTEFTFRRNRR